jgi:glycosyltransferase involved in cell wall biosynthesis
MARYLRESEHEIVHGHGLWMLPALYAGLAPVPGRLFVISPRGMLADAAMRRGTLRKRAFAALVQRRALGAARLWHATCMAEAAEIRAAGFTQPVAVVPNGIALPPARARRERREVLALARLHPKKGLDRLVDAWAQVEREETSRGWWLTLAGPDEAGTRARLAAQAARLGLGRVRFTGPLYGAEKSARLARAAVFALPSLNENFGMAAAEALAAGTPVIASRGTPWSGLEAERCGWWVPGSRDALAGALRAALALPPAARAEMGARGRRWMARDFGWPRQAEALAAAYEWARAGARLVGACERQPPAAGRFLPLHLCPGVDEPVQPLLRMKPCEGQHLAPLLARPGRRQRDPVGHHGDGLGEARCPYLRGLGRAGCVPKPHGTERPALDERGEGALAQGSAAQGGIGQHAARRDHEEPPRRRREPGVERREHPKPVPVDDLVLAFAQVACHRGRSAEAFRAGDALGPPAEPAFEAAAGTVPEGQYLHLRTGCGLRRGEARHRGRRPRRLLRDRGKAVCEPHPAPPPVAWKRAATRPVRSLSDSRRGARSTRSSRNHASRVRTAGIGQS